ncbi:MAG: hypothetical protein ACREEM_19815 [Blastocatellia bacterium]
MTGFPSIDELEIALLTGQGIAVIVEGDSYEDDPWFYGQWFGEFETKGIIRTPRYTLENYLLDPACWAAVFKGIFKRNLAEARGWDDERQVTNIIIAAYSDCLGVTAHNWIVKIVNAKYSSPTFPSREYLKHYKSLQDTEGALQSLADWGVRAGVAEDLREMFENKHSQLIRLSIIHW